MLFHANSAWLPAGFIGVDVFFVISGFVVSRLVLDRQFDWWGFYLGRVRRIVPAYLFMLVVIALIAIILLIPQDFKFFRDSLKSATIFTSNHYFSGFGDYFAPSSHELPLLHTWSLAIEMQFYLVLPLLLVWLPRPVLRIALPLFIAATIAWSTYKGNQFFSFLARSAEFGFGVWLAAISPALRLSGVKAELVSVVGAVLLLLGFFIIPEAAFPGVWVLLPCLGCFLIIAARDASLNRVLSNRYMVGIGTISYSLYLWHWPVLAFMRYYTQQYELSPLWLVAYVAAAFALAVFSYRYVETPFRKSINLVVVCGGTLFTLGLLATSLMQGKALNGSLVGTTLPVELTRYADDAKICHGKVIAECIRGDLTQQPVALVIGDSHAAQLNLAFDEIGIRHGLAFQVVTASSCVPIEGFDVERLPDWAQNPCMDQIAYVKPLIASANIVVLAGKWHWQAKSPAFIQALESFLADMQKRGIRLFVLSQVPMLDFNAARAHRFTELGLPLTKLRAVSTDEGNSLVSNLVKKHRNTVFVDVSAFDLFKHPPFYKNGVVYHDSHHLNEIGAREYGREFEKIFLKSNEAKQISDDGSLLFYNGPIYIKNKQAQYVAYLDRAGKNWLHELDSGRKVLVHDYYDEMARLSNDLADDHAAPAIIATNEGDIIYATAYHGTDLHIYRIKNMEIVEHKTLEGRYTYPMLFKLKGEIFLFVRDQPKEKYGGDLVVFKSSDGFSKHTVVISSKHNETIYAAVPFLDDKEILVSYAVHRYEDNSMRDFYVTSFDFNLQEKWACDLSRLVEGAFYNRPTAIAKKDSKILLGTSYFDKASLLMAQKKVFSQKNKVLIVEGEVDNCESFHTVHEKEVESPYYNTDVHINENLDFIFFGKSEYFSNLDLNGCFLGERNIYPRFVERGLLVFARMNRDFYNIINFDNSLHRCKSANEDFYLPLRTSISRPESIE